ncbi:helix-turn-helix transcriptional regulator [Actinomadura atramentaria]|uniref:helix-turn-helix transcriptional regulator n=1 Tax=Actinomadura atramentaria TaxID=1990 RepID=UPI0003778A95|nr:helix-turn-helix transcriptional regulator [Actinomadura atramentaria]
MTTVSLADVRPVGDHLREWRRRRRMSQLELAAEADVSTRHLSFLETGRSAPSREMVLRLAEHLDVPLRDRNLMLVAAGYAPVYAETPIEEPRMDAVRAALRQVLAGHEPYPAVVVDRFWNLVESNEAAGLFLQGAPAELLRPPLNVLRLSMHPAGMARNVVNLPEWRAHMIGRLRRHVALTGDAALTALYRELRDYPDAGPPGDAFPPPAGNEVLVPLRMRVDGRELSFFSTIATFGSPLDITVAELAIESFYPADAATGEFLREGAAARRRPPADG